MAVRGKLGRSLLLAGVLTAAAVPAMAGAAYAGTPPHPTTPPGHQVSHNPPGHQVSHNPPGHQHGTHASSAHHTTTLTTTVPDAHIRDKSTTVRHSRVIATLHTRGSEVEVTCRKTGMPVSGDSTWYKTVTPARGYIAAAMLDRTTADIPVCAKK